MAAPDIMGDSWEVVDKAAAVLARYTGNGNGEESRKDMILRYIASITPKTAAGQSAMGGAAGCISGYLLTKIGKAAAFTVGSALLGMQIAHYYGYVKVDWKKIHKDLGHRGTEFVRRSRATEFDQKSLMDFIKHNLPLSGGFAGGFLLGMAFS